MTLSTSTDTTWQQGLQRWRESRLHAVSGPYGSAAVVGTYWLTATPRELPDLPGRWFAHGAEVHAVGLADDALQAVGEGPSVSDGTIVLRAGQEVRHGRLVLAWFRRLEDQALRVFDDESPSRSALEGIGTFAADPSWVVAGRLVRSAPGTRLVTDQSDGDTYDRELVGRIVFTYDGAQHELLAFRSPVPGRPGLMVSFADATSGAATFRFRFLLLPDPEDDVVTLDFNRAYLPPFAFAPSHSCPLPPEANHLPFAVTAGETLPLVRS
ncbi:DUF1684 domain-containing protein [Xylanimonas allomyrinae]|uniref:DUF1684 domain-containing protein n=1 Tax=Xylanimonas allomyrinae TaxID=2509459 RepID=A0A4P6EHX6_9MICO|nr:DUF1684 domain-containing protein [Xylanimonas allomyrinae]QAY62150.1 DUF1684 domain-containing protein [Xylanimonas allomyrinae]